MLDPMQHQSAQPSVVSGRIKLSAEDPQLFQRPGAGKRKRPMELEAERAIQAKPLPKKPKKAGVCRLFNSAPGGFPYGRECIFTHCCYSCGAVNEHHRMACPFPQKNT